MKIITNYRGMILLYVIKRFIHTAMDETSDNLVVMIIDDDPDEHFIIEVALKTINMIPSIINAYSAEAAREQLQLMQRLPDLIILDIHFGHMDGLSFLDELRQSKKLQHIPVMLYSGSLSSSLIERAREHGATSFMEKTHDVAELGKTLQKKLKSPGDERQENVS